MSAHFWPRYGGDPRFEGSFSARPPGRGVLERGSVTGGQVRGGIIGVGGFRAGLRRLGAAGRGVSVHARFFLFQFQSRVSVMESRR